MAGERLREYSVDLADYVLGQIRPVLRTLPERPSSAPRLRHREWDRLDLPTWLGRGVAALPGPLADHVWAGVAGDKVLLPMNDAELFALEAAVDEPPMRLAKLTRWEPYPALHRLAVECVPEIRMALTPQTADEWAVASAAFATRLCEPSLSVAGGIGVVREWLWHLQLLLRVMCATHLLPRPLGTHPTPTQPNPAARPAADRAPIDVSGPMIKQGVVREEPPEPRDPAVCGRREAMAITGLKKTKVYDLFRRGVLKGYRDGSTIRFYRTGLLDYMRERENNTAPPPRPARRPRKTGPPATTRFKFL